MNGGPELVIIVFVNGPWKEVAEATGGNGHTINVTRESFNDFISNVLDKDVKWKAVMSSKKVLIPGTWSSKQATVGGSRRARSSKSNKPTKRRRSRRVYRKTKKN